MAVCCIGGVCIPYSALIPFIALGLRWLAEQLIRLGLLPESVREHPWLGGLLGRNPKKHNGRECDGCSSRTRSVLALGVVHSIQSHEEWQHLLETNQYVVCKFTADWCRPCIAIQPLFESLAQDHDVAIFCTINVDDLDSVAAQYNIAMMPTFIAFKDSEVQATMTGSNKAHLQQFLLENLQSCEYTG